MLSSKNELGKSSMSDVGDDNAGEKVMSPLNSVRSMALSVGVSLSFMIAFMRLMSGEKRRKKKVNTNPLPFYTPRR